MQILARKTLRLGRITRVALMPPRRDHAVEHLFRPILDPDRQAAGPVLDIHHPGPGPARALRLRLYRGLGTAAAAVLPCLLFLHGGGWVIGDLESHDGICRALANAASCCVVAVDYRLAPEHRFPAALDDAASALASVFAHAAEWRIDPARVAVGGDSAGGNLAAVLALMAPDGALPAPVFQLLAYPVTELAAESSSYARVTEGVPLTARTMRWFIEHYTPDPAQRLDGAPPRSAPDHWPDCPRRSC